MRLFTQNDLANILGSNNAAIDRLVNSGKIPYKEIGGVRKFCPEAIAQWLKKPELKVDDKKYIERFKKRIEEKYPESLKAIKEFSGQFSDPGKQKGFILSRLRIKSWASSIM
jgi:hypothetical protein